MHPSTAWGWMPLSQHLLRKYMQSGTCTIARHGKIKQELISAHYTYYIYIDIYVHKWKQRVICILYMYANGNSASFEMMPRSHLLTQLNLPNFSRNAAMMALPQHALKLSSRLKPIINFYKNQTCNSALNLLGAPIRGSLKPF